MRPAESEIVMNGEYYLLEHRGYRDPKIFRCLWSLSQVLSRHCN